MVSREGGKGMMSWGMLAPSGVGIALLVYLVKTTSGKVNKQECSQRHSELSLELREVNKRLGSIEVMVGRIDERVRGHDSME